MVSNGEEQQSESKRPTTHSAHRQAERRTMAGIGKFGEVTPLLYRGAQPDYKGFKALAESGVQIVVDTRGHREKSEGKEVKMLGMKYVAIPWHCPFPPDDTFAKFLKLIKENPKKKIFVHCRLGDDRTGMMIAAYRMADEGWTADEAMREMQKFGFNRAHHFICPRLASYEKSFPERLKHNSAFKGLR
jgi:protein tyrosine phosphatase (PTP) superfamily phosphohydrolase (DUF442 family)